MADGAVITVELLKQSLDELVGKRLERLETHMKALLSAQGLVSEKPEPEKSASEPPAPSPPAGPPPTAQSTGGPAKFAAPARTADVAPTPQQGAGAALSQPPVIAEAPPMPPPANPPPPPADSQPVSLQTPAGEAAAMAARIQQAAALAPPGPQTIEVTLQRPNVNATWGFLWDRPAFLKQQRIIDDIVADSPAGRWKEAHSLLKKGDELMALDGKEGWEACSTLSKLVEVHLRFRRAPETNGQGSSQPDPEIDPETVGKAGDQLPGTVPPQGDQQRADQQKSVEPTPSQEAPESRESKIEKQMTLLRQLSDSKKEVPAGQTSGVTSLMTQVDDLTKLANLLAQGEANQALELVKPLLRKQVRQGQNGEPEYEAVDATEAARFLLEVMEVMESSSKSGSAVIMPKP